MIQEAFQKDKDEDEYKIRNYIIPYFTRNNEQNIFDLYDKNEIKYFRNLTLTKIEIIPYKRDNFVSFTYFYFLNKNNQIVTILNNSDDTVIYKSPVIKVGESIDEDVLAVQLEKGQYDCKAIFSNVNADEEIFSEVYVNVKITVNN